MYIHQAQGSRSLELISIFRSRINDLPNSSLLCIALRIITHSPLCIRTSSIVMSPFPCRVRARRRGGCRTSWCLSACSSGRGTASSPPGMQSSRHLGFRMPTWVKFWDYGTISAHWGPKMSIEFTPLASSTSSASSSSSAAGGSSPRPASPARRSSC